MKFELHTYTDNGLPFDVKIFDDEEELNNYMKEFDIKHYQLYKYYK